MEKEILKQVLEEILAELRGINEASGRKETVLADLVQKVTGFDQKLGNVRFQVAAPDLKPIERLLSNHLGEVEDKVSRTAKQVDQFESRRLLQEKQVLRKGWPIVIGFAVFQLIILLLILIK